MKLYTLANVTSTFGTNHFIFLGVTIILIILSLIFLSKHDISFDKILIFMIVLWLVSQAVMILTNINYIIEDD